MQEILRIDNRIRVSPEESVSVETKNTKNLLSQAMGTRQLIDVIDDGCEYKSSMLRAPLLLMKYYDDGKKLRNIISESGNLNVLFPLIKPDEALCSSLTALSICSGRQLDDMNEKGALLEAARVYRGVAGEWDTGFDPKKKKFSVLEGVDYYENGNHDGCETPKGIVDLATKRYSRNVLGIRLDKEKIVSGIDKDAERYIQVESLLCNEDEFHNLNAVGKTVKVMQLKAESFGKIAGTLTKMALGKDGLDSEEALIMADQLGLYALAMGLVDGGSDEKNDEEAHIMTVNRAALEVDEEKGRKPGTTANHLFNHCIKSMKSPDLAVFAKTMRNRALLKGAIKR